MSLNTEHFFRGAFDSHRACGRYLPLSSVVDDPHQDDFYFILGGSILRQQVDAVWVDAQGIPLGDTDDNLHAIELVVDLKCDFVNMELNGGQRRKCRCIAGNISTRIRCGDDIGNGFSGDAETSRQENRQGYGEEK